MRDEFEKLMQAIAGSTERMVAAVILFGVSAGLLEFAVHMAVVQAGISPVLEALIDAGSVTLAAALFLLLLLLTARDRHRRVLDDLRRIAQLNHHVRNAMQTILYSEYLPDSEANRKIILEGVDRVGRILQELFPAVGERVEDKRWKVVQISRVRGFVPDRRQRS